MPAGSSHFPEAQTLSRLHGFPAGCGGLQTGGLRARIHTSAPLQSSSFLQAVSAKASDEVNRTSVAIEAKRVFNMGASFLRKEVKWPTGVSLLAMRHGGAPGAPMSSLPSDKSLTKVGGVLFLNGTIPTTRDEYEYYEKTLYSCQLIAALAWCARVPQSGVGCRKPPLAAQEISFATERAGRVQSIGANFPDRAGRPCGARLAECCCGTA